MKTAALIANIGLLVAMLWYLLTIQSFQAEGLELAALVLAVGTPILSIVALLPRRSDRRVSKAEPGEASPAQPG
jgi:hypothetical protein